MIIFIVVGLAKKEFHLELDGLLNLLRLHPIHLLRVELCVHACVRVQLLGVVEHLVDDGPLGQLLNVYVKEVLPSCTVHSADLVFDVLYLYQIKSIL